MDLGIAGKKALVCASSKGLGKGCALALAEAGVDLVLNARGSKALNETAEAIRSRFNVRVEAVVADITTPEGQEEVLTRAGAVDILVNNAGGPPPGMWSDWGRDDFMAALNANMLTPIALMSRLLPTMIEKGWGRVVNITSQSVKAPIAVLGLSNSARAGLTGYVAGTARQVAPFGVTISIFCRAFTIPTASCLLIRKCPNRKGSRWNRWLKNALRLSPRGVTAPLRNSGQHVHLSVPSTQALWSDRTYCLMEVR